jgi:hypothetical protein
MHLLWHKWARYHVGYPCLTCPVVAVVVVLSAALSAALFAVLLSRRKHQLLLRAMLPKKVIDALEVRVAPCRLPHDSSPGCVQPTLRGLPCALTPASSLLTSSGRPPVPSRCPDPVPHC